MAHVKRLAILKNLHAHWLAELHSAYIADPAGAVARAAAVADLECLITVLERDEMPDPDALKTLSDAVIRHHQFM